jgi:hypothetical protein
MWKRFLIVAVLVSIPLVAADSRPKRRVRSISDPVVREEEKPAAAPKAPAITPREAFTNCMDNMCYDEVYEEKGRCSCSNDIVRIERVLATIEDMQRKADAESAELEELLGGGEVDADFVSSFMAAADGGWTSPFASNNFRLGERAFDTCSDLAPDVPNDEKEKWLKAYMNRVDADCVKYSAILKERTDALVKFYLQVKKNREIFDRQERDLTDQIEDTTLCYMEYEACAVNECGEGFGECRDPLRLRAMLQTCQTMNRGKCDSQRMAVMDRLRTFILRELK